MTIRRNYAVSTYPHHFTLLRGFPGQAEVASRVHFQIHIFNRFQWILLPFFFILINNEFIVLRMYKNTIIFCP
jgi:hypothetical protein